MPGLKPSVRSSLKKVVTFFVGENCGLLMLMWKYEYVKECVCDIFVCMWEYKSCEYINESISFNTKYSLACTWSAFLNSRTHEHRTGTLKIALGVLSSFN